MIDGFADGQRVVLGHAKTRESLRAGLAMYFVTLDDASLMELADDVVAGLGIEHFFNIQLVGDLVIEVTRESRRSCTKRTSTSPTWA